MTTPSTAVFSITFSQNADTIAEAAVLLREAIGQIKCLSDSLVGKNPSCAEKIGITDKRGHAEIRKFTTVEGLVAYQHYLETITNHAGTLDDSPSPTLTNLGLSGFSYTVASGRATINLFIHNSGWQVSGHASFKNPQIAHKNLSSKGFTCHIGQIAI